MNKYYVYILANKKYWILYVWITNNLLRRIYEHKEWKLAWFTRKYFIKKLVYFEEYDNPQDAIFREKQLKKRKRDWKIELIEKNNLNWNDLYNVI